MNKWKEIFENFIYSIKMVFNADKIGFLLSVLIQIINTAFSLILLYIGKRIINQMTAYLMAEFDLEVAVLSISKWVVLFFIILFCLIINNFWYEILLQKLQMKFGLYIDREMSKKILELEIAFFDSADNHDQIAAALDGKSKMNFLIHRVTFGISNLLNVLMSFIIIYTAGQIHLTMILFILIIPSLIFKGKYTADVFLYEDKNRGLMRKISYLSSLIYEKYAAKEIRFHNVSDFLIDKYKINWGKYFSGLKKIIYKQGMVIAGTNVLSEAGIIIIMFCLINNIISKNLTIGDFIYLFGVFGNLKSSALRLVDDMAKLEESNLAIKNYKKYMSLESKTSNGKGIKLEKINRIEFDNVSFKYPNTEEYVLDGFCLAMQGNDKIAIVGINGAGKSTIIKLLLRFYNPDKGEIRINGERIQEYLISDLREKFSILFQDYMIYLFDIKRNIIISDMSRGDDEERIWYALKCAGLDELFANQTVSLATNIGKDFDEYGLELSGGTKQKLAIARAVFRYADCLVMDEPNAALDLVAEKSIIDKIKLSYKDKGIIMVSHRLGSLDFFDCIYVIERGKVVEKGNQSDLLRKQGEFYKLFCIQKHEKWEMG